MYWEYGYRTRVSVTICSHRHEFKYGLAYFADNRFDFGDGPSSHWIESWRRPEGQREEIIRPEYLLLVSLGKGRQLENVG